jgi:hypothetical protein
VGVPTTYTARLAHEARERSASRALVESLRSFWPVLQPDESRLLGQYYGAHLSIYELAKLAGTKEWRIRNRLRSLIRRMTNPAFKPTVIYGQQLPDDLGRLMHAKYVRGISNVQLARSLAMTLPQVAHRLRTARNLLPAMALREAAAKLREAGID